MPEEKNKSRPSFAKATEGEKNKDDCPLCRISPETIAALKKAKKIEKKEKLQEV